MSFRTNGKGPSRRVYPVGNNWLDREFESRSRDSRYNSEARRIFFEMTQNREAARVYYPSEVAIDGRVYPTSEAYGHIPITPHISAAGIGGLIVYLRRRRAIARSLHRDKVDAWAMAEIDKISDKSGMSGIAKEEIAVFVRFLRRDSGLGKLSPKDEELVERASKGIRLSDLSTEDMHVLGEVSNKIYDNLTIYATKERPRSYSEASSPKEVAFVIRAMIEKARHQKVEPLGASTNRQRTKRLREKFIKENPGKPLPPELQKKQ